MKKFVGSLLLCVIILQSMSIFSMADVAGEFAAREQKQQNQDPLAELVGSGNTRGLRLAKMQADAIRAEQGSVAGSEGYLTDDEQSLTDTSDMDAEETDEQYRASVTPDIETGKLGPRLWFLRQRSLAM